MRRDKRSNSNEGVVDHVVLPTVPRGNHVKQSAGLHTCGCVPERGRICIWGVGHLRPNQVRQRISWTVGVRRDTHIVRLARRSQRYTTRYDLYVKSDAVKGILRCMRREAHRAGWRVKEHLCRCRRSKKGEGQPRARRAKPSMLASWNVHGLKSKRADVEYFLQKEHVAVLALQETLRGVDDWRLRLSGYQCIEAPMVPGEAGKRGVALAIAPSLICHETGTRSDNWVWAKVYQPRPRPQAWIISSVYIPAHGNKAQRTVLERLEASVSGLMRRFPECPMVLMGDWNMDRAALAKVVGQWGLGLKLLECRGSG